MKLVFTQKGNVWLKRLHERLHNLLRNYIDHLEVYVYVQNAFFDLVPQVKKQTLLELLIQVARIREVAIADWIIKHPSWFFDMIRLVRVAFLQNNYTHAFVAPDSP